MGRTNLIIEIESLLFELRQENEMLDDLMIMFFNEKEAKKGLKRDINKWADIYVKEDDLLVRDKIIDLIVELNKSFHLMVSKYKTQNN